MVDFPAWPGPEWEQRLDLAACYRAVSRYRMTDLIYNHITARVPGSDHEVLIFAET